MNITVTLYKLVTNEAKLLGKRSSSSMLIILHILKPRHKCYKDDSTAAEADPCHCMTDMFITEDITLVEPSQTASTVNPVI